MSPEAEEARIALFAAADAPDPDIFIEAWERVLDLSDRAESEAIRSEFQNIYLA